MIRQRAYFFDTPATTAGDKLRTNNIPSETTFRDFLDSVPFKSESADYASATTQGLVKLASDADSRARTGTGVIIATQLPELAVNTTPLVSGNASYQGIKVTAINQTTRLDYQVDFDPTSLTAKTTYLAGDFAVIVDTADSNKPKKILLSTLIGAGSGWWDDTGGVLSPITPGDDLNMAGGYVNADLYTLKAAADTYLYPLVYPSNKGANLRIVSGAPSHATDPYNGGELYLYGGAGVNGGTNGNILLAYDGSNPRGTIGIGGAVQSGYIVAVTGGAYLNGKTYVVPRAIASDAGATVSTAIIYGNNGVLYTHTFKDFMSSILGGAPAGESIIYYDGSDYTSILTGAVDSFLHKNAGTGALEFVVLDMTDRVTDSSVAATGITPAKIIGATGSNDVVALFDSATGALKLGTYKAADLGVQKTLDAVIVTATTDYSGIPDQLPSRIVMDTTSGNQDITLPAPADVPDKTEVEFIQWAANTATVIAAIQYGHGLTSANIALTGADHGLKVYASHSLSKWVVASYF